MEKVRAFSKSLLTAAALATMVATGVLIGSPYAGADNDNNGAQDEKQMIRIVSR